MSLDAVSTAGVQIARCKRRYTCQKGGQTSARKPNAADDQSGPNALVGLFEARQPVSMTDDQTGPDDQTGAGDQTGQITELLHAWKKGDVEALRSLVPLVYKELRRLAHRRLRSERPDHTLQSAELVHEAYLRLQGGQPGDLRNRAHFLAIASRQMREILVDYARTRRANKRDGGRRIALDDPAALRVCGDTELLALDTALDELSRLDERQGKIVEMKFFGGLSSPEISEVLGISRATIDRDWATARVWLHRQMSRRAQL